MAFLEMSAVLVLDDYRNLLGGSHIVVGLESQRRVGESQRTVEVLGVS